MLTSLTVQSKCCNSEVSWTDTCSGYSQCICGVCLFVDMTALIESSGVTISEGGIFADYAGAPHALLL